MRKGLKQFVGILSAAVLACSTASLAACGYRFDPLQGGPAATDQVSSNGGFVVEKGEYIYFINGVETYTSNNKYGTPVKGALMRAKKADLDGGNGAAETVIPSLMVSGDTTAGIFIYGDRIYYATPNNMKNTSGVVENTYLDFKSAKLDGSDIESYFYLADNSTKFRYVEAGEGENKAVYLVYAGTNDDGQSAIISYNTSTKKSTTLVSNYLSYAFDSADKTNPEIYYTMSVTDKADSDGTISYNYQQIYRVSADTTAAPYEYTWDQAWLDENNDGKIPYENLGTIVLDGRGQLSERTENFNHSDTEPDIRAEGYNYTLRSYTNGGIYFVRTGGSDGNLYYLAESKVKDGNWDSVKGNFTRGDGVALVKVASDTDVSSRATASALYFIEDGVHKYLYVSGDTIYLATAGQGKENDLAIAFNVSGAALKFIDNTSDANYKYVYFSKTNGSGTSVERAVYNGEEMDYRELQFEGRNTKPYKSVKVLDLQHATGWYDFEVIGGTVFYADTETLGSVSYNYVSCVNLKKADGALKNNEELAQTNDKYNEIMGDKGLVSTLSSNGNSKLSALISYYFKSGKSNAMKENIDEAVAAGQAEDYLFSEAEQTAFKAFVAGEGDTSDAALFGADDYKDGDKSYRTISYFVTRIGKVSEADEEAMDIAWRNTIQRYAVAETEEKTGLEGWEIALIVIAVVIFVAGCAGATMYILKRKQTTAGEEAPRMEVDTTDDRDVDVYADDAATEPVEPEVAEEAGETAEEAEEPEPAEEPAEEEAETPAEAPAETAAEPETSDEPPQA